MCLGYPHAKVMYNLVYQGAMLPMKLRISTQHDKSNTWIYTVCLNLKKKRKADHYEILKKVQLGYQLEKSLSLSSPD